jgi:exosome complex RNA-binding protein Csl4
VALTCPNCGNTRTFLVETLQMHVVQVDGDRVDVAEEGRPGVIECLCDECDTTLVFDEIEDGTRREILLATGAR